MAFSILDPSSYSQLATEAGGILEKIKKSVTQPNPVGVLDKIISEVKPIQQISASAGVSAKLPTTGSFDFSRLAPGTKVDKSGKPVDGYGGAFQGAEISVPKPIKPSIPIYGQSGTPIENPIKTAKEIFGYAKTVPEMQKLSASGITKGIAGFGRMAAESEVPLKETLRSTPFMGSAIASLESIGALSPMGSPMTDRERGIREGMAKYFDKVAKSAESIGSETLKKSEHPKLTSIGASIHTSAAAMVLESLGIPILATFGGTSMGQSYQEAMEAGADKKRAARSGILVGLIEGGIESLQYDKLVSGLGLNKMLSNSFWGKPQILKTLGLETLQEWVQSTGSKLAEEPWRGEMKGKTAREKLEYLTDDYFDSFLTMLPMVLIPGVVSSKVQSDYQSKLESAKKGMEEDIQRKMKVDEGTARLMVQRMEREAIEFMERGGEKLKYLKTPSTPGLAYGNEEQIAKVRSDMARNGMTEEQISKAVSEMRDFRMDGNEAVDKFPVADLAGTKSMAGLRGPGAEQMPLGLGEPGQNIEGMAEKAGGWAEGSKAVFDRAILEGDSKKILEMLPSVPKEYKNRFASDISKITGMKVGEAAGKPAQGRPKSESEVYRRLKEESPAALTEDVLYKERSMMEDSKKAVELVSKDKVKAFKVAMGAETLESVTSTAVNIAMSEKAYEDGDYELYSKLVKNRSLAQTRRGQELVAEKGSVSDNSASRYVKELVGSRMEKLGKGYLSDLTDKILRKTPMKRAVEAIDSETEKAFKSISKAKLMDISDAQALIDSLAC